MYRPALSFLACFALAAGSGYVPGREYIYRYRLHVSAGFPDKKPQYSGLAYEAKLHIQPKGDYAIFQLKDRKFNTFNGDMTQKEKQPYRYEDLSPIDKKAIVFKVFFKDGKVTHFQVNRETETHAVNVRRGVLSLFHLTFEPDESGNRTENEIYKPGYGEHYYKTMEDGVMGQCETHYVVEHLPYYKTPENNIVLNITKTRNYHKCNSMPNHYYSTFYGDECRETEKEKSHTVHGNAFYHYDIRGDRHHYVIEKVTSEGNFRYTPYPLEGQTTEIFVNRSLELIEEKDSISKEVHVSDDLATYHSLEYDFDYKPKFKDQIDLKQPHYLYHIYGRKVPLEQIRELFAKLIHVYDDKTYHEAAATKERDYPAIFLELVKAVSTLGYDDIVELYKEYADFSMEDATPDKLLTRSLFFDVLVNTGTNPALLFGKTLVKTGKVPEQLVLHFLQQIPYHIKEVTQTILDETYALCKDDYMVQRPKLYTACYLTLANIIHDRCVARYHPERDVPDDEYSCPEDVPVTFFKEISKRYKESDDEYRKTAYITALGRLGVKESLEYLRHYIEGDAHQNLFDRTNAIYALGPIARRYPELVRELVIPLYYNTSENYQVRIAAFNIIINTHPELYELETIARNLIEDKDDQVRSYVYSTFRSYDNSTHPCHLQLAHDVRYALSILKPYRHDFEKYDHSYSHLHYVSGYNSDYGYGGFTKLAYLASDTGYIPRTVYLQVNDFLRGKSFNTFSIGFTQHGLEKLTDKIFGPEGSYWKKSFFDLFKKRTGRDVNDADKTREEIKEKLHLPTKEYEHVDGEIFFKYMGNQFSFLYFNESTFENFIREGTFEIPDVLAKYKRVPPFHYQRFMMPIDLVYLIPSEVGLPIIIDFKHPAYFYHKNDKLKFEVNPAFFKEDRQDQHPTDIHANIGGHFVLDKQLIGSVGVVNRFRHHTFGAGINRRSTLSLPIELYIGIGLKDHKVNLQWKPVVPHQIYHFEFEPYTYIDLYDDNLAVVNEEEYHPVRRMGYRKQISKELELAPFGLKLHVDKDFDDEWNDYGSMFSFIVRKSYRDKFYYSRINPQLEPYKYNVTLDNVDGETITEVDTKFDFSIHRNEAIPQPELAGNHFEEFGKMRIDNMIMTVIRGEVVAHGGKERRVQGEIIYSVDVYDKYHELQVYYDRTPFFRGETDHLRVCISGYLEYHQIDEEKLARLETLDMRPTIDVGLKAHFGKDCSTHQKIIVHGEISKTEEQLELERHRDEPDNNEHYNPYSYLYQQCVKERTPEILFPKVCHNYVIEAFTLYKYAFDIKYKHLSPRFLNMTQKVDEFLRHELYDHSDTNYIHGPEGEAHVEFNVSAVYPVADIRVRTPSRNSHYTHIHAPRFKALNAFPSLKEFAIKKFLNSMKCKVIVGIVETFDHYAYRLPPIDCWKVVSKDCSPDQSFIVLTKKTNLPEHMEAAKIIMGKHVVEMGPLSDDSKISVKVDGKIIPISGTEHYYHYEEEHTEPLFDVGFKHDIDYTLQSEQCGLIVEYDGVQIAVEEKIFRTMFVRGVDHTIPTDEMRSLKTATSGYKIAKLLSPYYRSKVCGLCGNYNGQQYDQYIDENGCHIDDDTTYAYRFAIPSETCSVPETNFQCHGGDVGCTELKTEVLEITKDKIPQTCFSTEPIPHCRTGCQSQRHFTRVLSYHCLPAADDSTKHLLAESKIRILHETKRKSKDHEGEVEIQEGCHRA